MIRLVLFDIDGTLILTGGAGEKAFGMVCEAVFGVPNGTAGLQFAGRTDTSIVRDFFTGHDIEPSAENFRRFFENYVVWLRKTLREAEGRVLPGIQRWLEQLQADHGTVAVGLLTGNIRHGAEIKLSHYQLWPHFQFGAYGDDHEDRNEIARIALQRGRERMGESLRGEEVLVIGDTPRDVACGRAIGAKVLAVATGSYHSTQLRAQAPDWVVETVEEMELGDILGS